MSEEQKEEGKDGTKKKKGKGKLFLLIGIGLVVVGGGATAAVLLLGGDKKPEAGATAAAGEHGAPAAEGGHGEQAAAAGHGAAGAAHGTGEVLLPIDTFVVNLSDARGDRFLKLSVKAVTHDEALEKTLAENELVKSRLRDRVISVLAAKTYQEISNPIGKEGLRRELSQELNSVLGPGTVSEVLFTEFIVQ